MKYLFFFFKKKNELVMQLSLCFFQKNFLIVSTKKKFNLQTIIFLYIIPDKMIYRKSYHRYSFDEILYRICVIIVTLRLIYYKY